MNAQKFFRIVVLCLIGITSTFTLALPVAAANVPEISDRFLEPSATEKAQIADLIESSYQKGITKFADRVVFFSTHFLGTPYYLGYLGEGLTGLYDQDPLYRFNGFDCTTFVETIYALAYARDFEDFERLINLIRYKDGKVSYITRNHFTSLDWIGNNIREGFFADVTQMSASPQKASIAKTVINKPLWYQKSTLPYLMLQNLSETELQARLLQLQNEGRHFRPETVETPYLTFKQVKNKAIQKQIPNGAVINIVRPNREPFKGYGTPLNIAHQGLAIWKNGKLYLRNATSKKSYGHQVADVLMTEYLDNIRKAKPGSKGINILFPIQR